MIGLGLLLTCLGVLVGCWIVYQLIRQNGRILLRLESLEQRLAQLQAVDEPAPANVSAQTLVPSPPPGLPIGSPAPAFELPSLSGERVTLSQFRGQRLLLTFFNPQCGFCAELAPALSQLSAAEDTPPPVVVTRGGPELNRRFFRDHEIKGRVLLQDRNEVAERYSASGTPAGYLIDEDGRIASALALGGRAVLALAGSQADAVSATGSNTNRKARRQHHGNLPLSASKIKRDGLLAGTRAPDFRLERVDGGELALSDYRGWPVLLVFSDPHCGPCSDLAPKLEAIHSGNPDLRVLMVSRGDPDENRQKVAKLGLTFPVVVQKQWEVSRAYGMFATPIGYLIDGRGVVARDVATGGDAILALADGIHQIRRSNSPQIREVDRNVH
jgi:peroxiredoxin